MQRSSVTEVWDVCVGERAPPTGKTYELIERVGNEEFDKQVSYVLSRGL